ncbi:MAG: C39 family peptidase [Lachnospiraceae bacterium]|nr:C39 family peptidase [Lachnospiraceae bacterium]
MKYIKRLTVALLAAIMLAGAFAGTEVTAEAVTTSGIEFDAVYYAAAYPDVKAAFGTNETKLLNHYLTYGISEGRSGTGRTITFSDGTVFDADYYAAAYPDVVNALGDSFAALYNHYVTYGVYEGRHPSAYGDPTDISVVTGTKSSSATTTASTSSTPSGSHQISNFEIILQYPELPTGCESVASAMLISYYGFSVDKVDLADNYLPTTAMTFYYDSNGTKIGPDMENYFVGNPHGTGAICGVSAIKTEVNSYLSANGSSLQAIDKTGISLDELYSYIDNDTPVMVWVTIYMANRKTTKGWYTEDGRYMEYASNDHGAVLIGYTDTTVTIADPISGKVTYSRAQFEKVFASRGNIALIIE